MDLGLTDKVALVTGASSGIGAATARLLAAEGADVVVHFHRNVQGAGRTAGHIRQAGRRAWICRFDMRKPAQIRGAVAGVRDEVPALDIAVLCAGRNVVNPLSAVSLSEWRQLIEVNLNGAFNVLHIVTPMLREGGAVVTVASVAAHTGAPHHAHYAAAKAGLINLTKSTARDLAPRIRVNCVAPGITLTPMGEETARELGPDYATANLLLQRFADPQEIARCIVFLASPAASFITGATLDANGGRLLR